uniref:Uncharacterized protein n=1 Tax=Steinernema glaseri TaxID=37863 RepID=A0A5K3E536_9BILA
MAEDYVH